MPSNPIGNRIKSRRKELHLTLQDVADRVHVARSTIQRYETGAIVQLRTHVLYSIAQALQVNPDWLACKSEMKFLPTADSLSRIVITADGLEEQRVYNDISEYEFSLLLAYRYAPPEIRSAIDTILAPYSTDLPKGKHIASW